MFSTPPAGTSAMRSRSDQHPGWSCSDDQHVGMPWKLWKLLHR